MKKMKEMKNYKNSTQLDIVLRFAAIDTIEVIVCESKNSKM